MKYVTRRPGRAGLTTAVAAAAAGLLLAGCGTTTQGAGASEGVDELKIIVPADPGGGWDQTGRAMQKDLQDNDLVDSAQVVNVGGAGGTVGTVAAAAAAKDGYSLMVGTASTHGIAPYMYKSLRYDVFNAMADPLVSTFAFAVSGGDVVATRRNR